MGRVTADTRTCPEAATSSARWRAHDSGRTGCHSPRVTDPQAVGKPAGTAADTGGETEAERNLRLLRKILDDAGVYLMPSDRDLAPALDDADDPDE